MKEDVLRKMIRKQIKSSLNEITPRGRVTQTLGRVEKMAGVKMLKQALGQGSPVQQASGLLAVVKAISGDSPQVAKLLSRMLQKKQTTDVPSETPVAPDAMEENKALAAKMGRLDNTQQMKMIKQALSSKSAIQQTDFVLDMIKGLDLKDSAKKRLFLTLRKGLKD